MLSKEGMILLFMLEHPSCRDTSIIYIYRKIVISTSKKKAQIDIRTSILLRKTKTSYENPEIIKCSYGMFLPFSDKSQGKFMLFTSTLSGHELMFQSPKCMPFLKKAFKLVFAYCIRLLSTGPVCFASK